MPVRSSDAAVDLRLDFSKLPEARHLNPKLELSLVGFLARNKLRGLSNRKTRLFGEPQDMFQQALTILLGRRLEPSTPTHTSRVGSAPLRAQAKRTAATGGRAPQCSGFLRWLCILFADLCAAVFFCRRPAGGGKPSETFSLCVGYCRCRYRRSGGTELTWTW